MSKSPCELRECCSGVRKVAPGNRLQAINSEPVMTCQCKHPPPPLSFSAGGAREVAGGMRHLASEPSGMVHVRHQQPGEREWVCVSVSVNVSVSVGVSVRARAREREREKRQWCMYATNNLRRGIFTISASELDRLIDLRV